MRVGDLVEDFELPDETRTPRRLSTYLRNEVVVLFFFPAALSPLCRAEACRFRDLAKEFHAVGGQPIGISQDPPGKQGYLARTTKLGYPLLADQDGSVGAQFDTNRSGLLQAISLVRTRRNTFIIGHDRRVLDVIKSEIRPTAHADLALDFLRNRERVSPTARPDSEPQD